jgi:hypothetical protein
MQKVLVISLSVALLGCDHEDRITRLEKETKQLSENIRKEQATTDYDLQAKCAKDSKTWFNDNWRADKDTLLLTYTNHYNKSQNKCFIFVEYHYTLFSGTWINDMTLWDIYENEKYGDFSLTTTNTFKTEERVSSCEVYGKRCTSADSFNTLVHPFLNN